jgi:hypothetical protein
MTPADAESIDALIFGTATEWSPCPRRQTAP